ncbi:MAG TPA: C10 family peptidase [Bacteroidales bacterium]|nr:C10 family peptidase [Bacteroidales bacterium]
MKKRILTILVLGLFGLSTNLFSQVINFESAELIAKKVFGEVFSKNIDNVEIADYFIKTVDNQPALYIFNESEGGFVIISGEGRTVPVLAYSTEAVAVVNESEWSPVFAEWINMYSDQIQYIRIHDISASQNAIVQREKIDSGQELGLKPAKDVSPLLSTTWNQGCGYNAQCPADAAGPCGRVYTGCVATAMAQVIRYNEHPINGTGSYCYTHSVYGELCADFSAATYDYSTMPNGSGNAEVAELMYHCGVSVNMGYSPTGSGAYSSSVPNAFKNYFDFKNVIYLNKNSYAADVWNSILRYEIDNSRPIYYSGHGSGGHAFVADGYQGADYFHFNWGWGGSYNGYFYCNDLTPGSNDFTNSQAAVIGAIPTAAFTNLDVSGAVELSCSTPLSQDLATGTNYINYYKNSYPVTPGKELVYYFTTTLPGRIRVKFTNVSDGDLYAILLSYPHQDSLIVYGNGGFILDDTEPGTYWLAIESTSALEPTFDIEVICPTIDADLIIPSAMMTPEFIESEQPNVNFNCVVKNLGNTTAIENAIEYFMSDDDVFDFGTDIYIGSDVVPELVPSASTNIQTVLTLPAGLTPGSKNIFFVVDRLNVVPEADDQNEYYSWATVPDPGLLDCSTSVALIPNVWYWDNTEVNGVNNLEDYWPATDLTAPEIVHSFIAQYSGPAKLYLTEKNPGVMNCMVFPVCNENTWLGSVWFNLTTDTLGVTDFNVVAGTEYFVVVDSKLPVQGDYGVKVELPGECPEPVIEYWGELNLCDGEVYPNFWTAWGYSNYLWYKDGLPIPDATSSNLIPSEVGTYYVEISENGCTGQSDPLTINMSFPPDTANIVAVGDIEFCDGGSVLLQMDNGVLYPLQWTLNDEYIPGANGDTFTATETGLYKLLSINGSCSIESFSGIEVIVYELPVNIDEDVPYPSDTIEFYYSFNSSNEDEINNYGFWCWDFLPVNDRNGNFWQARDFSGQDIFGSSSHYRAFPDEFTLSFWFNSASSEGGMLSSFVNSPWGVTSQDAVVYMSDDGKVHFWMSNGGSPAELSSVESYNDGLWHNVLITHDTGILMELDGGDEFLQISTPITHLSFDGYWTFAGPTVPATVSAMPTSQYFDGYMDDLLCLNESKYLLRNYVDTLPQLNIEPLGDTIICDNSLAYFIVRNSQHGVEYKVWNNTLGAWHPNSGIGSGGDISIGGAFIDETTEFHFYAVDSETLCEALLNVTYTFYVYPSLPPVLNVVDDGTNPLCEGTVVNFTANISDAGTNPVINWYVNDVSQGINSLTFNYEYNNITDSVRAELISDYVCPSVPNVISPNYGFNVLPVLTPSVTVDQVPAGIICKYSGVTFTANPVNCGASPHFVWYLNGNPIGSDSDTFGFGLWADGDEVYIEVTPDYACPSVSTVNSSVITMEVSIPPESDFTLLSGGTCSGEEICVEYSGETTGLDHVEWLIMDGANPIYYSGEGPHCFTPVFDEIYIEAAAYDVNGCFDTVWLELPAMSGVVTPSVSIIGNPTGEVCYFDLIVFEASTEYCGISPSYQWYRNGVEVGTNSPTYSDNDFENNEEIYVIVTNTVTCATSSTAESNHILTEISYAPDAMISVAGGNCQGDEVCVTYIGETIGLALVEWEILDGSTLTFVGEGPHCFIPVTTSPQIAVYSYNSLGCFDTATVVLSVTGTYPVIDIYDTIYRCTEDFVHVTAPEGYFDYEWSNGSFNNHLYVWSEGMYYLTVTNEFGCETIDSVFVIDYPDNDFDISDTTICYGETIILSIDNTFVYNSYFWANDGQAVGNSDTYEVVYSGYDPAYVYVEFTDDNCTYTDTIIVGFDTCSFVPLDKLDESFSIYPNPCENEICFESSELIESLIIYDLQGREIYISEIRNNRVVVDIKNWSNAVYYYSAITKSGREIKSKFVKF